MDLQNLNKYHEIQYLIYFYRNDNIKENDINEVIQEAKGKRITFADSSKEFLLFIAILLLILSFIPYSLDKLPKLIREV